MVVPTNKWDGSLCWFLIIADNTKMQYLCGFEPYKINNRNRPLWWFSRYTQREKRREKLRKVKRSGLSDYSYFFHGEAASR